MLVGVGSYTASDRLGIWLRCVGGFRGYAVSQLSHKQAGTL